MKNKVKIIISALLILFVSIILMVTFLILNKQSKQEDIKINAQDIEIYLGENKSNFYTINYDDVVVSFEIEDDNIISINNDSIYAKNIGNTKLKIIAEKDGKMATKVINILVKIKEFQYVINPIENCEYTNNSLLINGHNAIFSLQIFDDKNTILDNLDIKANITNGSISKEFLNWTINTDKDCEINFIIESLNYNFSINVILK